MTIAAASVRCRAAAALVLGALLVPAPAAAHPHVFVEVRGEIVYAPDGRVLGIRQAWSFDKGYSAFAVQGLDRNGDGQLTSEELAELAKVNIDSLGDKDILFFTTLKLDGAKQEFATPSEARGVFSEGVFTLHWFLPLKAPAKAAQALFLEVFDPTYYVKYDIAEGDDAVRLVDAPNGCVARVTRPPPPSGQQQNLSESFFSSLGASSSFGSQFVNKVLVTCP